MRRARPITRTAPVRQPGTPPCLLATKTGCGPQLRRFANSSKAVVLTDGRSNDPPGNAAEARSVGFGLPMQLPDTGREVDHEPGMSHDVTPDQSVVRAAEAGQDREVSFSSYARHLEAAAVVGDILRFAIRG